MDQADCRRRKLQPPDLESGRQPTLSSVPGKACSGPSSTQASLSSSRAARSPNTLPPFLLTANGWRSTNQAPLPDLDRAREGSSDQLKAESPSRFSSPNSPTVSPCSHRMAAGWRINQTNPGSTKCEQDHEAVLPQKLLPLSAPTRTGKVQPIVRRAVGVLGGSGIARARSAIWA
jgi:hypothetical protein